MEFDKKVKGKTRGKEGKSNSECQDYEGQLGQNIGKGGNIGGIKGKMGRNQGKSREG